MARRLVAVGIAGVLLASCSSSISVSELGQSCSEVGDRLAPPYYFGQVHSLVSADSEVFTQITRSAPVVDTHANVVALIDSSVEVVFDDGRFGSLSALWMDRATRTEAERLPDDLTVIVGIRSSLPDSPSEGWVQFVTVTTGDGGLAFVGDCADRFYRVPLERYRDAHHPDEDLTSVFLDVIADEEAWEEFNAFEVG